MVAYQIPTKIAAKLMYILQLHQDVADNLVVAV